MTHSISALFRAVLVPAAFALPLAACSTGAPATTAAAPTSVAASTPSPSETPSAPATSASPSPSPTPTSTVKTYTMTEVKQHAKASSCWSAIDRKVYDLTDWVNHHPGGRARILSLCGKDGTASFHGEHGKEAEPNKTLRGFLLGPLA